MKLSCFIFILLFSSLVAENNYFVVSPYNDTRCPNAPEEMDDRVPTKDHSAIKRNHELGEYFEYKYAVPGSVLLLYGLNIFKYEAFSPIISKKSENWNDAYKTSRGITEKLFEMRCPDFTITWSLPDENRNSFSPANFIVPDHILTAESYEKRESSGDIHYHRTYQDIITSLQGEVKFETDLGFLGGSSSSASYKEQVHTMIEDRLKIVEVRKNKTLVKLTARSPVDLQNFVTRKFVDSWNNLPDKYESSSKQKYEDFLDMFGTHYFDIADIGSAHFMRSETSEHFLNRYQEKTLKECAKLRFGNKESEAESDQVDKKVYKEYLEQSKFTEEYATSGGMKYGTEEEWKAVWPIHPWIVSGYVIPTYALIPNPEKSDNVRLALLVMQLKAFNDTFGEKIKKLINNLGERRIEYEGHYGMMLEGYTTGFQDDSYFANVGNCTFSIPEEINEMICCEGNYSVKKIMEAYRNIMSFYESPILNDGLIKNTTSDAKLIQVGLIGAKTYCHRAKRWE